MAKTRALQTAFLALSGSPFDAYSLPCIYNNLNKQTAEQGKYVFYILHILYRCSILPSVLAEWLVQSRVS